MTRLRRSLRRQAGFSLIEAIVGVALLGLVLAALANIIGHWLPNWKAGFSHMQKAELIDLGLRRIVADLAAAEYVSPNGESSAPLFEGSSASITFVRSAIGPNASGGLEIIRLVEKSRENGLMRERAPFEPADRASLASDSFAFADASRLAPGNIDVSFSFASENRVWEEAWSGKARLPAAVRITLRDAETDEILAMSTATLLHVTAPARCATAKSSVGCMQQLQTGGAPKPPPPAPL